MPAPMRKPAQTSTGWLRYCVGSESEGRRRPAAMAKENTRMGFSSLVVSRETELKYICRGTGGWSGQLAPMAHLGCGTALTDT